MLVMDRVRHAAILPSAMTARSGPKQCSQNIQKNRCRTTVAEPIGETLVELPFTGDQAVCLGHDQAAWSGPERQQGLLQRALSSVRKALHLRAAISALKRSDGLATADLKPSGRLRRTLIGCIGPGLKGSAMSSDLPEYIPGTMGQPLAYPAVQKSGAAAEKTLVAPINRIKNKFTKR